MAKAKEVAEAPTNAASASTAQQQVKPLEKKSGPAQMFRAQSANSPLPPRIGSSSLARAGELVANRGQVGTPGRARMSGAMQQQVGNARLNRMAMPGMSAPTGLRSGSGASSPLTSAAGKSNRPLNSHAPAVATPGKTGGRPSTAKAPIQRKCACGGEAGPDGECAACKAKRLNRRAGSMPSVQRKCACGGEAGPDGECASCKAKRLGKNDQRQGSGDQEVGTSDQRVAIQRQATQAQAPSEVPPSVRGVLQSSSAQPLSRAAREPMEQAFGQDFGGVRVHTGPQVARAARDINAEAFTTGQDIYFGEGRYQPDTPDGKKLLAHELTHTIQQGSGAVRPGQAGASVSQPDDVHEREAEAMAQRVTTGGGISQAPSAMGQASQIQRYPGEGLLEDIESAAESTGQAIVSAGEEVGQAIVSTGEAVSQAVGGAVSSVSSAVSTATSWIASTAGSAALSAANALVNMLGGTVTITPSGIIIDIPEISLFDNINRTFDDIPPEGFFIPLLEAEAMLGPLPVAGAVGILVYAQPALVLAVGPGVVRDIRIVIEPLSSHYAASGLLYVAVAGGPRLALFGGLAAVVGTVIPMDPPIPLVASLEGGLRGTGTGYGVGAIQSRVALDYAAGRISFNSVNDLMAGYLLQGDLDLWAAARIEGLDICHYAYRLGHWETGEAYKVSIPINAFYGGGSGGGNIGPITRGPIPITDIETAIQPVPTGFECKSLDEIKKELCKIGVIPEDICESLDEAEESVGQELDELLRGLGFAPLQNCEAKHNLSETAESFISRCCKASIRREFPGELLNETLGNIKRGKTARHKKAWKLLNDNRFKKPGASGGGAGPCPVPVNFRQTVGGDAGHGVLHFEYAWDSSTGNLADLSSCLVGEEVKYPGAANPFVWPKPPWNGSTPNPTIIMPSPGSDGGMQDNHSSKPFVKPYKEASFTATQHYRYQCPCQNGGNPVNIMGPIAIVRTVKQKPDGKFKYTITKSGKSASVDPLP